MRAALRIEPLQDAASPQGASGAVLDQVLFYGVFGLLLFGPLAFGAVEPWAIFTLEFCAASLFVIWVVKQVLSRELRITTNPLFRPMMVFAAIIFLQILANRTAYRQQTIHETMLFCAYGLLCFLMVQCLRKTSQIKKLGFITSIYGASVAILAILQSVSSSDKLYWLRTPSSGGWIYGPYVNHSHYAGLMEMLIPIPLVVALSHHVQRPRKILAIAAAALMASTIFLAGSRGGMVAFSVQMALLTAVLIKRKKGRATALALGAFLVIVVGLLMWLGGGELSSRMASIRSETNTEISGGTRLEIVSDGFHMFADRPLLGWGLGAFADVYPQYRSFYTNLFVNQAHNDYLQLLVEMGTLGFLTMLWFVITTYIHAAKKLGNWTSNSNGTIAFAAMLGITGILVHSFVDFNLQIPANAALFFILCTLAAMEPRFAVLHHRPRFRSPATDSDISA